MHTNLLVILSTTVIKFFCLFLRLVFIIFYICFDVFFFFENGSCSSFSYLSPYNLQVFFVCQGLFFTYASLRIKNLIIILWTYKILWKCCFFQKEYFHFIFFLKVYSEASKFKHKYKLWKNEPFFSLPFQLYFQDIPEDPHVSEVAHAWFQRSFEKFRKLGLQPSRVVTTLPGMHSLCPHVRLSINKFPPTITKIFSNITFWKSARADFQNFPSCS